MGFTGLPGLPGSDEDPGVGQVVDTLVDRLLADVVPPGTPRAAAGALVAHRHHLSAWYGDLIGPLRVPTSAVPGLMEALQPRDHALRVTLVVDPTGPASDAGSEVAPSWAATQVAAARAVMLDDDRIEIAGVELPLPVSLPPATAARAALSALDLSVPAWFVVPAVPEWLEALDVLAVDGAENVALHLPPGTDLVQAGHVLRHVVDRQLACAVTAGEVRPVSGEDGLGLVNALCAVRAALNGAEAEQVAGILAEQRPEPLLSAARRMSDADAAVVRAFLPTMTCPAVRPLVEDLELMGLIAPDAA